MTTAVRHRYSFDAYLRTGRLVAPDGVEHKFNPNHDPDTGRFTFADGGHPSGSASPDGKRKPKPDHPAYKRVKLTPAEYNMRADDLWRDMESKPGNGFDTDAAVNAAAAKADQLAALSTADVDAPRRCARRRFVGLKSNSASRFISW